MSKKCTACKTENAQETVFCRACGAQFKEILESYDAFISYRRDGGSHFAAMLKVLLETQFRKKIFLDVDELRVGRFDERLLKIIADSPNFILVLNPGSLDRCKSEKDWLRREIVHAFESQRNIIPVLLDDFHFPEQRDIDKWPESMRTLPNLNGIAYRPEHKDSVIRKIGSYLVSSGAEEKGRTKKDAKIQGPLAGLLNLPPLQWMRAWPKLRWAVVAVVTVLLIVALAKFPIRGTTKLQAEAKPILTEVRIEIAPWANLEEVRDASGTKVTGGGVTPLTLQLPPGEYQLKFSHPQLGLMQTPLKVATGAPNVYRKAFDNFHPETVLKNYE